MIVQTLSRLGSCSLLPNGSKTGPSRQAAAPSRHMTHHRRRRTGTLRCRGFIVDRHAPVMAGDPLGVREVDVVAHDPVTGRVIDLAGGVRNLLEHDVLVVTR